MFAFDGALELLVQAANNNPNNADLQHQSIWVLCNISQPLDKVPVRAKVMASGALAAVTKAKAGNLAHQPLQTICQRAINAINRL